jgi:hypothetical protein
MKQEVKIGQTDYTVLILLRDKTTGAPKAAVLHDDAGMNVSYTRVATADNHCHLTDGGVPVTVAVDGAHTDWGFILVDDTHAPGLYRLDIADGVFASGAWSAVVTLVNTACDTVHIEFMLVPESPVTGVNVSQWAATAVHASDEAGTPCVEVVRWAGEDVAATGINGIPKVDVGAFLGHAITNTGTQIADAFQTMYDVASPVLTCQSVNQVQDNATTAEIKTALETGLTLATLSVTGQLDAGNVLVDTTTVLTGNTTQTGNLLVTGTTTLTGNVTHTGTTTYTGAVTHKEDELYEKNLTITGATALTGAVTAAAGITANITGNLVGTVSTCTTNTDLAAVDAKIDIIDRPYRGHREKST